MLSGAVLQTLLYAARHCTPTDKQDLHCTQKKTACNCRQPNHGSLTCKHSPGVHFGSAHISCKIRFTLCYCWQAYPLSKHTAVDTAAKPVQCLNG